MQEEEVEEEEELKNKDVAMVDDECRAGGVGGRARGGGDSDRQPHFLTIFSLVTLLDSFTFASESRGEREKERFSPENNNKMDTMNKELIECDVVDNDSMVTEIKCINDLTPDSNGLARDAANDCSVVAARFWSGCCCCWMPFF